MSDNKKSPAVGGTTARAAEQAAGATFSGSQRITHSGTIASLLSCGRENARTGRELQAALGLSDPREITMRIERERRQGIAICANTDAAKPGYFLATSPAELAEYTRSLKRRIKNVSATLDALESALDAWTGQQRMEDD